jgi:hypothetical protein
VRVGNGLVVPNHQTGRAGAYREPSLPPLFTMSEGRHFNGAGKSESIVKNCQDYP